MEKRETAHGPAAWPGMIGGGNRNSVLFGRGSKGVTRRVEKGGSVCFERLKRREKRDTTQHTGVRGECLRIEIWLK